MLRGSVDRVSLQGKALEGNALGDPAERELIVYLPPSYHREQGRAYPWLMVLTGYASTNAALLNFKPWEPNFLERYERLLAAGCPEAILVLPDCFTRWGGSQYIDSASLGDYQRYLADDVLSFVESTYRTAGRREARGIVGKSSGGFGALRMGIDRPESFAVIGSHAGDCAFELTLRGRFAEVLPVYERHGGPAGFARFLEQQGAPRSQAEFHAVEMLALAAAYAPLADPGHVDGERERALPLGELPVDPYTAQIHPEKWQRWLAHDPLVRAEKQPNALKNARLVFLDAGKSDEYGLQFGARMLAQRLINSGVKVQHEEFEGGHMGTAFRYDASLPILLAALDSASVPRTPSRNRPL
ncbi:MAG: alpha/beta hydrolase-fold protein [Myxococcales bacterium]